MTKKILILPGDGIGQEVTASAVEVLDFIVEKFNLQFSINSMEVGGTAYDEFGSPIPSNVLNAAKEADAVLFGAVGGPKWDDLGWDLRLLVVLVITTGGATSISPRTRCSGTTHSTIFIRRAGEGNICCSAILISNTICI